MPRRIAQERLPTASNVGSRDVTWASQPTPLIPFASFRVFRGPHSLGRAGTLTGPRAGCHAGKHGVPRVRSRAHFLRHSSEDGHTRRPQNLGSIFDLSLEPIIIDARQAVSQIRFPRSPIRRYADPPTHFSWPGYRYRRIVRRDQPAHFSHEFRFRSPKRAFPQSSVVASRQFWPRAGCNDRRGRARANYNQ
jgi:hypothetical protein